MELSFQLIDCDYTMINNSPIVRLFGKTKNGKTSCVFYKNYYPYFFIQPKKNSRDEVINFLKNKFSNLILNIEDVEKFLPMGYQQTKNKLIKITLRDPSQVPNVRDELVNQNFIENIFEADILFKYRFMADKKICGMKWYKAVGKSVDTTTVKTNYSIEADEIKETDDFGTNLKIMCIDIEAFPKEGGLPDWKKDPIAVIGITFHPDFNGKESLVLVSKPVKTINNTMVFRTEEELLKELVKIVDLFDPDIITGYNINNFDFPYILERLAACKIARNIGRCKLKPATSRKIGAKFRNNVIGRIVLDVYELIKQLIEKETLLSISFSKATRLKRYGLDDVAKEFLGEGKTLPHNEVIRYWNGNEEEIKRVIEYTKQDAYLTLKLLFKEHLLDKFIELSKISGLLMQDVLDGGEAARVENLLLREFNEEGYVLPLKPSDKETLKRANEREIKGLKGALVLEPDVGLHTNSTIYLDFKAMYPSIYIYYNICPTTFLCEKINIEKIETPSGAEFVSKRIKTGVIPKIVFKLIKERDIVKKMLKITTNEDEKRSLDARQEALKRMTNAFYGYTGYIRARLYILEVANAITSSGRLLIQKTKQIVESDPKLKVIYGDTDSIMVKTQTTNLDEAFALGKELEKKVNQELEGIVQMKIENVFKSLLILTKKRYAGLEAEKINDEWSERIIMKGIETVRRDWCDLTSKTLYDVLDILLKEQNPKKVLQYIKDILRKLESNQIPLEDLVITKSISKPLHTYKGIQPHIELVKKMKKRAPAEVPTIGDRIGFVIIQGSQLLSNRAEDPEYVKQHGLKIDSKYYIESQIMPPLERVFEAIGVTKSELIGIGKQLILAEAIRNGMKRPEKIILNSIDGFICDKCNQTHRRVSLTGKCENCGGEILFYFSNQKSRYIAL